MTSATVREPQRAPSTRRIASVLTALAGTGIALGVALLVPGMRGRPAVSRLGHAPALLTSGVLERALPPVPPPSPASCPEGMLLVSGTYCPYVGHRCLDWLDQKRDRCRSYEAKPWCEGRTSEKRFCIDHYEYPNQVGVYPAVMASWVEADASCRAEGKRLCTESEWTFACEGTQELPYPYGFTRDPEACNIDRHYRDPDFQAFSYEWQIAPEVARLDQRVTSGSMPRCVSPFGVADMTGNVDEWVVNEDPKPDSDEDVSGLKGGYWGPIRARCRPITNSHNRWFRFYQVGFRCCAAAG